MNDKVITPQELENIEKYFGKVEDLSHDDFKRIRKDLLVKFHPDKFEKFDDDDIREMATTRFQEIENMSSKLELFLNNKLQVSTESNFNNDNAQFSFESMKIQVQTRNKDLKYYLFGTRYRQLSYGENYIIPNTNARIITDESHEGNSIGFNENIRLYLTFGVEDSVELIAIWFYQRLKDYATALIIEGNRIKIDLLQIYNALKQRSYIGIEAPKS